MFNVRRTAINARNPSALVKSVNPVAVGGIHPSDVISGAYSLSDRVMQQRQRIANIPNVPNFTAAHGGAPVTNWSGIIPFIRLPSGETKIPI